MNSPLNQIERTVIIERGGKPVARMASLPERQPG